MKNIIYCVTLFLPSLVVASEVDIKETGVEIVNSNNDRLCRSLQSRISNWPQEPLKVNSHDGVLPIPQTSGKYTYPSSFGHKRNISVKWSKGDFFNDGTDHTVSIKCSLLKNICSDKLVIHSKKIDYINKPEQDLSLDYLREQPYFLSSYHWPFKTWPGSNLPIMLVGVSPFTFENKTFLLLSDNYDKKDYWAVSLKKSKVLYPSGKYKGTENGSLDIEYSCHIKS